MSKMIKTEEEIAKIKASAHLVAETLNHVEPLIKPGVTTAELDRVADDFIMAHGGYPAFKGYKVGRQTFQFATCMSTNDAVVHGLPTDEPLKEGDILSVDVGVKMNGWYGDGAWTFAVGNISDEKKKLMAVTKDALMMGVAQARVGAHLYDISRTIQDFCESHGYGVVKELVGHGIGEHLHEEPQVPNFMPSRFETGYPNIELQEGMTLAIEPMINLGTARVKTARDKWTVITADGKASAHFEHTIVVRKDRGEILTQ
ncbi:MAG: type I methionyl aminopeptidase [Candidatus Kapaibacterium sp.]|jgi:methionyl aminopeptidase